MTDATPAGARSRPSYPVNLELDAPLEVHRWRPLVNWLLAIPQLIVVYVLNIVLQVLALISFFTVLFTKRIPEGMFATMAMVHRYQWRVMSFAFFMRNQYPPFEFTPSAGDTGTDPAVFSIEEAPELNRWLPLVKWLLAIPHYIVLVFLFIGVAFVKIVAFFAVIFTGRYPEGLRNYVIGVFRWATRVSAYVYFMTDAYPPFSLEAQPAGR
jgi:roadblock/LC7 domain-containing protein